MEEEKSEVTRLTDIEEKTVCVNNTSWLRHISAGVQGEEEDSGREDR